MTTTQTQLQLTSESGRGSGLVVGGLTAAVVAGLAVTVVAALAGAAGVDFELPDGGEAVPLAGFAVVTFGFSLVGLVLAGALRRWARRPSSTFIRVTVALTALSLVPPWFQEATVATSGALVVLHLVAAAIVIPALARRLAD